ncbi:hypothetical protein [Streptomyces sp. DH12]|uniref:hypothetical protein n=1 Tax=Streptomyces sp. DH12 TaxID=2857010 RepID=UPI001E415305|nr:hypothetical protein [Streptomyces sp. DH12]
MNSSLTRAVLLALLVAGAVGGAAAYSLAAVAGADRTAPTITWGPVTTEPGPDPAAEAWRGRTSTPLARLLLPVPDSFRLGPDIDEHGNDAEFDGRRATALLKGEGWGPHSPRRHEVDRWADGLGARGAAMRSYATEFMVRGGVYTQDVVMTIRIFRLPDAPRAREAYLFRTALAERAGFDDGPDVEGHRNVRCHLAPPRTGHEGAGVAEMECAAYTSDLLVGVSAQGMEPFDAVAVADLVKDQLDHITAAEEHA